MVIGPIISLNAVGSWCFLHSKRFNTPIDFEISIILDKTFLGFERWFQCSPLFLKREIDSSDWVLRSTVAACKIHSAIFGEAGLNCYQKYEDRYKRTQTFYSFQKVFGAILFTFSEGCVFKELYLSNGMQTSVEKTFILTRKTIDNLIRLVGRCRGLANTPLKNSYTRYFPSPF